MARRSPARRSTLPSTRPPSVRRAGPPPRTARPAPPPGREYPKLPPSAQRARSSPRAVAHIIDDGEKSLVDVLDSLLNQGVVLNADLVLALANVDLVYVRLSALLCAADRVMPRR